MYFTFKGLLTQGLFYPCFTEKETEARREVSCNQEGHDWHLAPPPICLPSSTYLLEVLLGDEATGISDVVLEGLRAHDVLEFQKHVKELEDHLHVG